MIPILVHTFESCIRFLKESVDDIPEQRMVEQPTGAQNHGMWTLGHVVYSCHAMAVRLGAEQWLPDEWEATFGYGSILATGPAGVIVGTTGVLVTVTGAAQFTLGLDVYADELRHRLGLPEWFDVLGNFELSPKHEQQELLRKGECE